MNLLEIFAKLGLDSSEYDKGLSDASSKAKSFGSKIGSGLATAAKVGAAAVGAAATAVGALVKQSVDAYGSYEQLVGGVETLFGDSAGAVLKDAQNAFKTAGMSMNEYMETSIQSAASLINSLDGDQAKAAELMNVSITDMADNVNKMGTSMESVQNAYRGFSRGNFTMLDNLALGFAGTKAGMEELLEKAEEYAAKNGEVRDYSIDSYADIVEAIHVVQKEMGITGTTAAEAAGTIQGSLSSVRSAWQNLITGLADENADFETLVDNLVSGVVGVVNNMAPRIQQAIKGVGLLVKELAPVIAEALPDLVSDLAPPLFDAAVSLLESLGQAIGENSDKIANIVTLFFEIVGKLLSNPQETGIFANIGKLIQSLATTVVAELPEFLKTVVSGMTEILPDLLDTILDIALTLVDTLTDPEVLGGLVDAAIELIMALADGLIAAVPRLIEKIPDIIDNLIMAFAENGPKLQGMGVELWLKLASGVMSAVPQLISKIPEIILSIVTGFFAEFGQILQVGKDLVEKVKEGFQQKVAGAKEWGKDLISGFINGILEKWENLKSKVTGVVDRIKGIFTGKNGLDTHSPSKWAEKVFKNVMEGAEIGVDTGKKNLFDTTDDMVADLQNRFNNSMTVTAGASDGSVYALLAQYLPQMANQRIVLDSGTLVGELTPGIDTALGQRAAFANRRAAT